MLSRNFRLQRAGDVNWLLRNYNFSSVSTCIDELLIVDVSRHDKDRSNFLSDVRRVIDRCFIPVALGGGIADLETARLFIASGADKIVINSIFDTDPSVSQRIADMFGSQAVIGGIDLLRTKSGAYRVASNQGGDVLLIDPADRVEAMCRHGIGEVLVQSIDRDGTGFGFDFDTLASIGVPQPIPLILCGGCGKSDHMLEALNHRDVDAIATANLFNFIGDGLQRARRELLLRDLDLAHWDITELDKLEGSLEQRSADRTTT